MTPLEGRVMALFIRTVSFVKESTPESVKFEPDAIATVPPTNVQLLQLQVELMVMVTPGLRTSSQLLQMVPLGYAEELKLEVIGITVLWAFEENEIPVNRVARKKNTAIWFGFIKDRFFLDKDVPVDFQRRCLNV